MPHTSTGTVRVTIINGEGNTVVFVPDHDHLAKNGESKHAVFFDEDGDDHKVSVPVGNGGIQLGLPDEDQTLLSAALFAATTGTKVKIKVGDPQNQDQEPPHNITGIEVPAP